MTRDESLGSVRRRKARPEGPIAASATSALGTRRSRRRGHPLRWRVEAALAGAGSGALSLLPDGVALEVLLGDEAAIAGEAGGLSVSRGALRVHVPGVDGVILKVGG